jgi:hypothetical protein
MSLKTKFSTFLPKFWIGLQVECKTLIEKAVKIPMTFSTSSLGDTGLSEFAAIRSKNPCSAYYESAYLEDNARFPELCNSKENHPLD